MKKIVSVLVGVSVFLGISGINLVVDTNFSHVEAAVVAQQDSSQKIPAKSKVKSSLGS